MDSGAEAPAPINVWLIMPSGHIQATVASSIATFTWSPWPVRSRASSAAVMACATVMAVSLSGRMVRM